jgi:hypothetical protein
MEFQFRLLDERKEELLESRIKEVHIVMVNFRRNMVGRSVLEFS